MYKILNDNDKKQRLLALDLEILQKILSQETLLITDEDQLLDVINGLYVNDQSYSVLYEYVDFLYCSSSAMQIFLELISIENINENLWKELKERLSVSIKFEVNPRKCKHETQSIETSERNEDASKGFIYHLKKQAPYRIKDNLKITASSIYNGNDNTWGPYNTIYDDKTFSSDNYQNSWICFEFKTNIVVTNYAIRSSDDYFDYSYLRNWKIEIVNSQGEWEEIDHQNNCLYLKGPSQQHTFTIKKPKQTKCIRLAQGGTNWDGTYYLTFNSIEFY